MTLQVASRVTSLVILFVSLVAFLARYAACRRALADCSFGAGVALAMSASIERATAIRASPDNPAATNNSSVEALIGIWRPIDGQTDDIVDSIWKVPPFDTAKPDHTRSWKEA